MTSKKKQKHIFVGMDIQTIIVLLIFCFAVFYVSRLVYKSLNTKKSCGGSCKCGVDFSDIDITKKNQS